MLYILPIYTCSCWAAKFTRTSLSVSKCVIYSLIYLSIIGTNFLVFANYGQIEFSGERRLYTHTHDTHKHKYIYKGTTIQYIHTHNRQYYVCKIRVGTIFSVVSSLWIIDNAWFNVPYLRQMYSAAYRIVFCKKQSAPANREREKINRIQIVIIKIQQLILI